MFEFQYSNSFQEGSTSSAIALHTHCRRKERFLFPDTAIGHSTSSATPSHVFSRLDNLKPVPTSSASRLNNFCPPSSTAVFSPACSLEQPHDKRLDPARYCSWTFDHGDKEEGTSVYTVFALSFHKDSSQRYIQL